MNLEVRGGRQLRRVFRLLDGARVPIDLDGAVFEAQLRRADGTLALDLSEHLSVADGAVTLQVPAAAVTDDLVGGGRWELVYTSAATVERETLLEGAWIYVTPVWAEEVG